MIKTVAPVFLFFFAFSFAEDTCTNNGVLWDEECEDISNFNRAMNLLQEATFNEYKIQILNCSSGEPVEETYIIDHTHDFLWEKRHEVYKERYEEMYNCRKVEDYPTQEDFAGCYVGQRIALELGVEKMILDINSHLEEIAREEQEKCNNIKITDRAFK